MRRIAICVATFRRPEMLDRLLVSLAVMKTPPGARIEIRVIDNDASGSAAEVVARRAASGVLAGRLRYAVEPVSNIALARNAAVAMGPADLLLFIDDDEVADPDCLCQLVRTIDDTGADAVIGFVGGVLPPGAPAWIWRGGFFDHPAGPEGQPVHWRGTRCGCTLVRGHWFAERGFRFNPSFGRSGAEDVELFARIARDGGRFTGNPRARALESIEPRRLCFRFLWRRAWRSGLCYQRLLQYEQSPRRRPLLMLGWRCLRATLQVGRGVPTMLAGRPERCVKGLLGFALAGGGLVGWLRPDRAEAHVCYGAATPATVEQGA